MLNYLYIFFNYITGGPILQQCPEKTDCNKPADPPSLLKAKDIFYFDDFVASKQL